jgi:hypothetical protein
LGPLVAWIEESTVGSKERESQSCALTVETRLLPQLSRTTVTRSRALRRLSGNGEVTLSADYVAHHVELAYATTAYRAQGCTVQTAHAFVSPTTTREALYVAATRGREVNRLYVHTRYDPDPATSHYGLAGRQSATEVLVRVLARQGADLSAHEVRQRVSQQAASWAVLAQEYNTIAQEAQRLRWDKTLSCCGLDEHALAVVRGSPAFGPLLASMREAEAQESGPPCPNW